MTPSLLIDHAAAHLGVSRRTIYNFILRGRLETIRVGHSQRVTIGSLEAFKRTYRGYDNASKVQRRASNFSM